MDRLIDDITDRYLDRLPEDRPYHTAEELQDLAMPAFLAQRILLQLRRHLLESLPAPRSEWADLQSREVTRRWEDFQESAGDSLRLPEGRARAVFREAVEGCLELLSRPREVIPRLLFGSDRELTRGQLEQRLDWLVVYPHFHSLLPRYMEKKELESLDRDRCASIISRADRKLCRRYGKEEWMGLLDPLFELTEGRVPSPLLADFFRDKEMPGMAENLEEHGGELDRKELRELLSGDTGEAPAPADHDEVEYAGSEPGERPPAPAESDGDSLNARFSQETEETEQVEETVWDEAAGEPDAAKELVAGEEAREEGTRDKGAGEEEEEPTPMWMRYLEPGEEPEEETAAGEEARNMEIEQEEEPLFDPPGSSGDSNGQAAHLEKRLEDERDYFVKEIFGGSEHAYDRALEEIASRDDWRSASRYIEQEIFKRNLVDMYSVPAVDFTDRLHSWFMNPSNTESQ